MATKKGWVIPLAKAADRSDAAIYLMLKGAGRVGPYSEYDAWSMLRARGLPCKGYKPTADAVGKPVPPLGEKQSYSDGLVVTRLAKLLPGGANVNNKTRVRMWLKKAGKTDYKTLTDEEALEVMRAHGIPTDKFEYKTSAPARTPAPPPAPIAKAAGNGSAASIMPPAGSRSELIAQYTALQDQLRASMETIEQLNATLTDKDKRLASLVKTKGAVRGMLLQYESQIIDVAKKYFGGLRRPLTYPIQALDEIRED